MTTNIKSIHFLDLPDDALFWIFRCCDIKSLGRLAQCCMRINSLVGSDDVWMKKASLEVMLYKKSWEQCSLKELARLSHNLKNKFFKDTRVISHRTKEIPWMQLERNKLWTSQKNMIMCYKPNEKRNHLRRFDSIVAMELKKDVSRFRSNGKIVAAGSREGELKIFSAHTGESMWQRENCHIGDVHDVAILNANLISGSRDGTVKVWTIDGLDHRKTIDITDRVWSLAASATHNCFVIGSAGINGVRPLRVIDIISGMVLGQMSHGGRNGAGVPCVEFESPHLLCSGGYDSSVRLWDLRLPTDQSVLRWDDPHDCTVYCVAPDGHYGILSGGSRYGQVTLWDKRFTREPAQFWFTGARGHSSPVYSLAFTASRLFVALDMGIHVLDFSAYYRVNHT